jgi:hypothetical protein
MIGMVLAGGASGECGCCLRQNLHLASASVEVAPKRKKATWKPKLETAFISYLKEVVNYLLCCLIMTRGNFSSPQPPLPLCLERHWVVLPLPPREEKEIKISFLFSASFFQSSPWAVEQLADLFHTTHRTKTHHVTKSRGRHCWYSQLESYLVNAAGPVPLVLDLRIVHESRPFPK